MSHQYAKNLIDDIYLDGDRDIIFLEYIVGWIAFDEGDAPVKKTTQQLVCDVICILDFLISEGDFELAQAFSDSDDDICHKRINWNPSEFEHVARKIILKKGDEFQFVLRKIKQESLAPPLPEKIIRIFEGYDRV